MQGFVKVEPSRMQPGFSPFDDQHRQIYGFDEPRDLGLPQNLNTLPRGPVEQGFNSTLNTQQNEPNFNGVATGKGSRFAKFFDGKARDVQPTSSKQQVGGGFSSPSPNHHQRHEHTSLVTGTSGDQRAMDDLFAMLNNSAQVSFNVF